MGSEAIANRSVAVNLVKDCLRQVDALTDAHNRLAARLGEDFAAVAVDVKGLRDRLEPLPSAFSHDMRELERQFDAGLDSVGRALSGHDDSIGDLSAVQAAFMEMTLWDRLVWVVTGRRPVRGGQ